MSIRSDINKQHLWFRYEAKLLNITVLDSDDEPTNLSNTALQWRILRRQNSETLLLQKATGSGITVGGEGNNVVTIQVEPSDYDDLVGGVFYHELWDTDNNQLLSHGDVYIHGSLGHA